MRRIINLFPVLFIILYACSDNNPSQPVITENKLDFCTMKCLDKDCKKYELIARDTFRYYDEAFPRVTLKDVLPKNSGVWVVVLNDYDTVYSRKSFPPDSVQIKVFNMIPLSSKIDRNYRGFAYEISGNNKTLIDSCLFYYRSWP